MQEKEVVEETRGGGEIRVYGGSGKNVKKKKVEEEEEEEKKEWRRRMLVCDVRHRKLFQIA